MDNQWIPSIVRWENSKMEIVWVYQVVFRYYLLEIKMAIGNGSGKIPNYSTLFLWKIFQYNLLFGNLLMIFTIWELIV